MSQEIYMALRSIAIANESTRRGWRAFEEKDESLLMNYPSHGDDEDLKTFFNIFDTIQDLSNMASVWLFDEDVSVETELTEGLAWGLVDIAAALGNTADLEGTYAEVHRLLSADFNEWLKSFSRLKPVEDEDVLLKSIGAKMFDQYSESHNHVLFEHLTAKWAFGVTSIFSSEFNAIVSPSGIMYLDKGGDLVLWTTSLDRDDATWDVYKVRYSNKWDVVDTYCDYNARDLWYLFD